MDLRHYYTKNAKVIHNYQKWQEVLWSPSGWGYVPAHERAVICEQPRNEYGRFTNDSYDISSVVIRTEDGDIFEVDIDDIEPDVLPYELSDNEIKQLWSDMWRGSDCTSHYENSVGVYCKIAQDCYDGFWEDLISVYGEDEADEHDTPEEFVDYVRGIVWD